MPPIVPAEYTSTNGSNGNRNPEDIWQNKKTELLGKLRINPDFLSRLKQKEVIHVAESETIENKENPQDAKSELINIFATRCEEQHQQIIEALKETKQYGVLKILGVPYYCRDSTDSTKEIITRIKRHYKREGQVEYIAEGIDSTGSAESIYSTDSTDLINTYNLSKVYEDPKIKETKNNSEGKIRHTTSAAANLFKVGSSEKVKTLIVGKQLIGKSALMKMMCYRWAEGQQGDHIPLLIFINHKNEGDDFDSTVNNALPFLDDNEKKCIHEYCMDKPGDIMYAIDGIDYFKDSNVIQGILEKFHQEKHHFMLSTRPHHELVSSDKKVTTRILEIKEFTHDQAQSFRKRYREKVFPESTQDVNTNSLIPGLCKYECNYLYDCSGSGSMVNMDKVKAKVVNFIHEREDKLYFKQNHAAKNEAFQKLCHRASSMGYKTLSLDWVTSNNILDSPAGIFLLGKRSKCGKVTFEWLTQDIHKILSDEGQDGTGQGTCQAEKKTPFSLKGLLSDIWKCLKAFCKCFCRCFTTTPKEETGQYDLSLSSMCPGQ